MSGIKISLLGAVAVAYGTLAISQPVSAAALASFDNNSASNPFASSNFARTTSVSGTISDPDFNGGTDITLTFFNPVTGVGITNPANPDFSIATASVFNSEGSGFGVADATINVGRFERSEAFTMTTDTAIVLGSLLFHEWNGDEVLNIQWTQDGVPHSDVFEMVMAGGTAPWGVVVNISGVQADANSQIIFTNVSPSTANASGRLRFRNISVSAVPEPTSLGLVMLAGVALLRRRRLNA